VLVKNAEQIFEDEDIFHCYDKKLKNFLCKINNISYIGKGKDCWLFLRSNELEILLDEWVNKR